jgi:hypothetical protein
MDDFTVCQHGTCRHQPAQQPSAIAQRLEELMRKCREDQHQPTYADLLQVARGQA